MTIVEECCEAIGFRRLCLVVGAGFCRWQVGLLVAGWSRAKVNNCYVVILDISKIELSF